MTPLIIKNADDRRTVAAILAENGYSVKIDRVTVGKTVKGAVVYWKDEGRRINNDQNACGLK